jgi:hypothetical protein
MSEKIIRAKKYDRLWFLGDGYHPELVEIIAWSIGDDGPATPITAVGRFDTNQPYVIGTDVGFVAFPEGRVLRDYSDMYAHVMSTSRVA